MTSRTLYRAATAAVVTGVAGVALATPAAAMVDPAPPPNANGTTSGGVTTTSTDDSPWAEIGAGIIAGVALAGVGVAASAGLRRRSVTHPA